MNVIQLEVSSHSLPHKLIGFGTEWDPFLLQSCNRYDGVGEAEYALIRHRITQLRPHRVRIMVQPQWYEPVDYCINQGGKRFDFQTEAALAIESQLMLAQQLGTIVNITFWCANAAERSWLSYHDSPEWCSAPNSFSRYAENIAAFLQYMIRDKGYTCIQDITLYNEPSWAYYTGRTREIDFSHYSQMTKTVFEILNKTGLNQLVKLITSDDAENYSWFCENAQYLGNISDYFSSHTYEFSLKDSNADIAAFIQKRRNAAIKVGADIPILIDEFGTSNVIPPMSATDIYTYERGLFLAKFVIAALNEGASGVSYWCMHDQNYGSPSNMMEVGMWGFVNDQFTVRPTYHAWSSINRYTERNSEIYPILSPCNEELNGVALKAPDGAVSYLVCNLTGDDMDFRIWDRQNECCNYQSVLYSRENIPADDTLLVVTTKKSDQGVIYEKLPSMSFAVYRTI